MKSVFARLIAYAVCLLAVVRVAAAAEASPARLMPDTAAVYAELGQAGLVVDQVLSPRVRAILERSSAYSAYLESNDFVKVQTVVSLVEAKLDRKWPDIVRDLAGGLYFCFDPATKNAVLMIRAERPATLTQLQTAVKELIELDAANNGRTARLQYSVHRGVTCWSFGPKAHHAIVGDLLVVTNSPEVLDQVIDRQQDPAATGLAGTAEFKQARNQVASGELGWSYVRTSALGDTSRVRRALAEKSNNPVAEMLLGGVVGALRSTPLLVTSLRHDAGRLTLRTSIPADPTAVSASRPWFFPAKADSKALRPKGMLLSLVIHRDLAGLWNAKDEVFDEPTAAKMSQADTNLGLYFGGRTFSTDVLGQLGPEFQLVVARQEFAADQPVPQLKLPAAALVLQMREPDNFSNTLLLAYQKIVGLANLVGGQTGKPQLLLGSEKHNGVSISQASFLPAPDLDRAKAPVFYNASPACARVGDRFIFGTTTQLVRDLIDQLQASGTAAASDNARLDFDPVQIAAGLNDNRDAIVSQNMLKEGHTREQAEGDVGILLDALKSLRDGSLRLAVEGNAIVLEAAASLSP